MVEFKIMPSKKKQNGVCVYCGVEGPVTEEHVPPQNLFPGVPNDQLIWVPACLDCNTRYSTDDEYFRMVLTFLEDVQDHLTVQQLVPVVKRSLNYPEAAGHRRSVINNIERIQPLTASGLLLPPHFAFRAKDARLRNVIEKTTRGLFLKFSGQRLPDDYHVEVLIPWAAVKEDISQEELEWWREYIIQPVEDRPFVSIGKNDFWACYEFGVDDPNCSLWLYVFYEKVLFVALTLRNGAS